jgi:hypothetical protein
MRNLARLACVSVLLGSCACVFAADELQVWVTVNPDGKSCVVRQRETLCANLPGLLTEDFEVSRSASVAVSPKGCGAPALEQARVVGRMLKEAGFTQTVVIGFLSEPNHKCAPDKPPERTHVEPSTRT